MLSHASKWDLQRGLSAGHSGVKPYHVIQTRLLNQILHCNDSSQVLANTMGNVIEPNIIWLLAFIWSCRESQRGLIAESSLENVLLLGEAGGATCRGVAHVPNPLDPFGSIPRTHVVDGHFVDLEILQHQFSIDVALDALSDNVQLRKAGLVERLHGLRIFVPPPFFDDGLP
jgi:hypothetical protein